MTGSVAVRKHRLLFQAIESAGQTESSWPTARRARPVPHPQGALLPLLRCISLDERSRAIFSSLNSFEMPGIWRLPPYVYLWLWFKMDTTCDCLSGHHVMVDVAIATLSFFPSLGPWLRNQPGTPTKSNDWKNFIIDSGSPFPLGAHRQHNSGPRRLIRDPAQAPTPSVRPRSDHRS